MTKVVLDEALRAKLDLSEAMLELCDEEGHTVGFFYPAFPATKPQSPFSEEELERRRQQRTGRSLVKCDWEVWQKSRHADLESRRDGRQ